MELGGCAAVWGSPPLLSVSVQRETMMPASEQAGLGGRRWARPTWPACLPPGLALFSFSFFVFFCKEELERKKRRVGLF